MLSSLRKNGLTSLFKEVRVFQRIPWNLIFGLLESEVSKRGWRTEGVGVRKSFICQRFRPLSFLYPFSYAALGEGAHISGELFGLFLGFVCRQPPPANPFSKPLMEGTYASRSPGIPGMRAPSSTPTPKRPQTQTMLWVFPYQGSRKKLRHGLSFSFPWQIQSLGWSGFWSAFGSDHGLSFLPRGQKHWGRGRRMSIEEKTFSRNCRWFSAISAKMKQCLTGCPRRGCNS